MTAPEQQPFQPGPDQPPLPGMEEVQPAEIPVLPMYRPYDHTVGQRIFATMMADADRLYPDPTPRDYVHLIHDPVGLSIRKEPAPSLDPADVQPPQDPDRRVFDRPGFERYPRAVSELGVGVGGLGRLFTSSGRSELRALRAQRRDRREDTADYVARRVLDPRNTPVDPRNADSVAGDSPTAKLGWVGTGKYHHGGIKGIAGEGDAGDIGSAIMGNPALPKKPGVGINETRPITWPERKDDRKIDRWAEKERIARSRADWLNRSYGDMLDESTNARLSYGERRLMGKSGRRAQRALRRASRYREKIKGKMKPGFVDNIKYRDDYSE